MAEDDAEVGRIARRAEAEFTDVVRSVEREFGVRLPRLASVEYTIDRGEPADPWAQAPYHRRFPALASRPWWSPDELGPHVHALARSLESEFGQLRREFDRARRGSRFVPGNTGYFGDADDWRHCVVLDDAIEFTSHALEHHPRLTQLLAPIAALQIPRKCYFALLRTGGRLANHRGGTNLLLRMHLGIVVPAGDAGLRVGGTTRCWREGEVLAFDDSFGHEAWNRTTGDRYILLLRVLHPELSDDERRWLPVVSSRFAVRPIAAAVDEVLRRRQRAGGEDADAFAQGVVADTPADARGLA